MGQKPKKGSFHDLNMIKIGIFLLFMMGKYKKYKN